MGAGLTSQSDRLTEREIVFLMMPVYYIHEAEITDADLDLAKKSWNLVIEDRSPAFAEQKTNPEFEHNTCISWFYSIFYERLFNVHPMCRPLFTSGIVSQGKFLVKMFTVTMQELAMRHCERGIRGVEYGIVGDVLFFSLRKSIGSAYTSEVETAWKKIFSSMLAIIVPLCIQYERTGVVSCEVERVSDSGNLLDSAAIASLEADKKIASKSETNANSRGSAYES